MATTARQLAAFKVLAMILAVRVLLLLALVGAFALSAMAMSLQTPISVYIVIAYSALVLLPIVFLETRKGGPSVG